MRPPPRPKVPLNKQLTILARAFRAARDDQERATVARQYAESVEQLITSEKWKRLPPLEDQLPDDWMPRAFYSYWKLRPPRWGSGRPTFLLEGTDDIAIVRALLPPRLVDACQFVDTHRQGELAPAVRTHVIERDAPVAILLDTHTVDEALIADKVRSTQELVRSITDTAPFDLFYCVPEIEAVIFSGEVDLRRLFPKFDVLFSKDFARSQPKQQLHLLFEKGEGPKTLSSFLDDLTPEDIARLQAKDPIGQLIAFGENNSNPVMKEF